MRPRRRRAGFRAAAAGPACLLAACLVAGCQSSTGGIDFERMLVQPSVAAYDPSGAFPDGKGMQPPPAGTVSRAAPLPEAVATGRVGGVPVERIPVPVDGVLLARGRDRFDVYCAPCHGYDGNAGTPVAAALSLRAPPSLHTPEIVAHTDGALFTVVSEGYGLMPSYAMQLPPEDRWAVVAYVRALQLSGRVALADLPAADRARVLERLGGAGGAR